MRLALLAAVALALAACASTPGASLAVCVPLGDVTPAQQAAAADALSALTPEQQAALAPVVTDWAAMRAADRACIASNHPPATAAH